MTKTQRQLALTRHVALLSKCRRCPHVIPPPVSGGAVLSRVMIIGQAPGVHEPVRARPFAHTAGKTLFRWFEEFCGLNEMQVRSAIYFAAVIRCFPGKSKSGTDRIPAPDEIRNCSTWLNSEIELQRPHLIIPVGKLAIAQFIAFNKLDEVIGQTFQLRRHGFAFDLIPLPHPSGASPWHKLEPGKKLLTRAFHKIARHSAILNLRSIRQSL